MIISSIVIFEQYTDFGTSSKPSLQPEAQLHFKKSTNVNISNTQGLDFVPFRWWHVMYYIMVINGGWKGPLGILLQASTDSRMSRSQLNNRLHL